ncbi:discoidin domain-containing protein [Streptacidiphilus sp. PAMC 29251]
MPGAKAPRPRRALGLLAVALAGTTALTGLLLPGSAAVAATGATVPMLATADAAASGRGAAVPFTEYAAVAADTNGTVLAPSRTFGTLASEAAGRTAVQLVGQGKYLEFTLTGAANAVDFHYSIPDSADGAGITDPLSLYVNGSKTADLSLTSKYSYMYSSYPFSNIPSQGGIHHYFDDVRYKFGSTLPAGTKVRLQVDAGDNAPSYTVDTADFQNVAAAKTEPAGFISVTDPAYGADPTGQTDATAAIQNAVNAGEAQGKGVWIPAGTFKVTGHIIVNKVTLDGAGPWYSALAGLDVGVYGNYAPNPSSAVHIADFAILGQTNDRDDNAQVNGVGGALGGGSTIDDLLIQNTKVGIWLDGPFDGLSITNTQIQDTTADGINLHDGITNTTISNNFIRNTGDDGIATWSEHNADSGDVISHNTVELPILANNIAVYGGQNNTVTDNVVADTLTQGGGIHVGNRFSATSLAGTTTIEDNDLIRTGVLDPNWQFGVGAVWFWASDSPMTGTINLSGLNILDTSYEAVQVIGSGVSNVHFSNINVDGAGTFFLQEQSVGAATFQNVTTAHIGVANVYNCQGPSAFAITDLGGNSSWNTAAQYCGPWPTPVYTYSGGGTTPPTSAPPTTTPPTTAPPTTAPPTTAPPTTPAGGNLAQGRPVTATSSNSPYVAANAVDGDANSYWESASSSFPQSIQVDLGTSTSVGSVVVKLPPATAWAARSQTFSVLGSTDGSTFSTLVGSAAHTFDPASGNTVTVPLPAGTSTRYVKLTFTANSGWPAAQLSELQVLGTGTGTTAPPTTAPPTTAPPTTAPPAGTNLALHAAVTDTGHTQSYTAGNTVDGDANSYWESSDNAFPQSITVDLGAVRTVSRVVLKLPPATAWATRTETIAVLGSLDNSSYTTLSAAAGRVFNPATGNTVTITFPATTVRYLRLTITGNTGWPAGQLSEIEAYAS